MRRALCVLLCVALLASLVIGCSSSRNRGPARATNQAARNVAGELIDPERLLNDLYGFADMFEASISSATSELAAQSRERRIRQFAILWRIRVVTSIQNAVLDPDPRFGFLSCWAIVVQIRDSLRSIPEDDEFEIARVLLLPEVLELEERLMTMVLEYVDQETVDRARPDIEEYAARHPLQARFSAESIFYEPTERMRRSEGINEILEAPMAPFRGLQGVGDTADAIDRVAMVAARIAEIAQNLPMRSRWQTELLLLELETMTSVVDFRAHLDTVTETFTQLVERVDVLPEDLREQLEIALDNSTEAQREVQQTLSDANALVARTQETIAATQETLAQATVTAEELQVTGATWERTAEVAKQLIEELRAWGEDRKDRRPFDIVELRMAAENLTSAVQEARALLVEAQAPLADDSAAREILIEVDESMARMVNSLTIRLAGVVVLGFVLMVVYRLMFRRAGAA